MPIYRFDPVTGDPVPIEVTGYYSPAFGGGGYAPYSPGAYAPPITAQAGQGASDRAPGTADREISTKSGWLLPTRRVYGRTRVPGRLLWFGSVSSTFRMIYEFGEGEIEEMEKLFIDELEIDLSARTAGTAFWANQIGEICFYLGTAAQDVSTCTIGSSGPWTPDSYSNGVDYVVVCIEQNTTVRPLNGFPRVDVLMKGINGMAGGYSPTPVRCLRHLLDDLVPGLSHDTTSFNETVAYQEESLGGSPRFSWGIILGEQQRMIWELLEDLQIWARTWVKVDDGTVYYLGDAPDTDVASATLTIDADSVVVSESYDITGELDQPDDVRVDWYDPDKNLTKTAFALGNVNGTIQARSCPYIGNYEEAKREAEIILDRALGETTVAEVEVRGSVALSVFRGEFINLTSPGLGLSAGKYRVMAKRMTGPAQAGLQLQAYNVATYSDGVQADPVSYVTNPADDPTAPPAVTGLAGSATAVGLDVRLDLSWTQPDYLYIGQYRIQVYDRGPSPDQLLSTTFSADEVHSVSGLPANVDFRVDVYLISTAGVASAVATLNIDKPALPTPPAPTNVRLTMLRPAVLNDDDGYQLQVTWDDSDFRAWITYRLHVYRDSEKSANRREVYALKGRGSGDVFMTAEAPTSDNTARTDEYYFDLVAVNADGVSSTPTPIYGYTELNQRTLIHWLSPQRTLVEPSSLGANMDEVKWYEKSTDGANTYTVAWGISAVGGTTDTRYSGAWINIYACDSGGTISKRVGRVFFSGGQLNMAADGYTADTDYGVSWFAFNGLSTVWDSNSSAAPEFQVSSLRSSYYRYKIQWTGFGDQVTEEYDLTVRGGSSTVHGPL